ncbi:BTB POZ fold [Fusarium globosum]|uniref:BTB POZ fold n=1 Tax=Fusarium globosum TaxID=78864 RepID=A0A8H5YYU3_9HYPO|nr:BTB POZ fold [Fusarium globosum]
MMLISLIRVATSKPFRFLIGPLQTEYTIHSALVAHQSPALAAMVNGNFQESRECCVKWDDVDEIVFNSFWQFVYTGDYDTPEPLPPAQRTSGLGDHTSDTADKPAEAEAVTEPEEPEPEEQDPQDPEPGDPEEEFGSGSECSEMSWPFICWAPGALGPASAIGQEKKTSVKKSLLWYKFLRSWEIQPEAIDTNISLKDQANPLVHHAQVFTLADRYGVKRLAEVSQRKLYDELTDLRTKGRDYTNIVELVRYTFEDLVPDQLRDMVVEFSACVVEKLWEYEEFDQLLEKHGILSKALIGRLLYRLAEPPSRLYHH